MEMVKKNSSVTELSKSVQKLSLHTLKTLETRRTGSKLNLEELNLKEQWCHRMLKCTRKFLKDQFEDFIGREEAIARIATREFGDRNGEKVYRFLQGEIFAKCQHLSLQIVQGRLEVKEWNKVYTEVFFNDAQIRDISKILPNSCQTDKFTIKVKKKKDDSLIGSVWIPLKNVSFNQNQDWNVLKKNSSTVVGSVSVRISKINPASPEPREAFEIFLNQDLLQNLNFPDGESNSDVNLKYLVEVKREDYVQDAFSFIEYQDRTIHQSHFLAPITNYLSDKIFFTSVKSSQNDARSKRKSRSSRLLDDSTSVYDLDTSLEPGPTVIRVAEDKAALSLASLPWGKDLVLEHNGTTWNVRIYVRNDGTDSEILNVENHCRFLTHHQLSQVPSDQSLEWNGELDSGFSVIEAVGTLLHGQAHLRRQRLAALMSLHQAFEFSDMAITRSLDQLTPEELSNSDHVKQYLEYCLRQFLFKQSDNPDPMHQNVIHFCRNRPIHDTFLSRLSFLLSMELPAFTIPQLLTFLKGSFLPNFVKLSSYESGKTLTMSMLEVLLDEMLPILNLYSNEERQKHPKKTYFIYTIVMEMSDKVDMKLKDNVFRVFGNYLPIWSDVAISEAATQMERVIKFEQEKYEKHMEYWSDWTEQNVDWLEGAINLRGIFDTCQIFWDKLRWPDPVENVRFGTSIFRGMNTVFKKYLKDFIDVVMHDSMTFDKHDFIILFFSALIGSKFLKNSLRVVNEMVEKIEDRSAIVGLKVELLEFSEAVSQAVLDADDEAENIIMNFCESQSRRINSILRENPNKDSNQEHKGLNDVLLNHLDNEFRFLDVHFDEMPEHHQIDKEEISKFRKILFRNLFERLDEEILALYQDMKHEAKRSGRPEVLQPLVKVVPDARMFRQMLSINESSVLNEIEDDLYPRCTPTHELIFEHMKKVKGLDDAAASLGEMRLKLGFFEHTETVLLQLQEISGIVKRSNGKKDVNASLTISIFPLSREPYIMKHRTPCFHKSNHIEFRDTPIENVAIQLPSHSYDLNDTLIEFTLYHTITYVFRKVFHASAIIALKDIHQLDMDSLKNVSNSLLKLTGIEHQDTDEFEELLQRKDNLAKIYLDRYQRQRKGKSFFETQEWAKSNELATASRLISMHLEEMTTRIRSKCDEVKKSRGMVTFKMAFDESKEELSVQIQSLDNLMPLPGDQDTNVCIGVRLLPTLLKEKRSLIHPNTTKVDFTQKGDGGFLFKLKDVQYNYHSTFIQIVCYDIVLHTLIKKKCEKLFRGHILFALSDIPPVDDIGKLKNLSTKKYPLQLLENFNSPVLEILEEQKDKLSKDYVEEFQKFQNNEGIKFPYQKEEWDNVEPEPINYTIISLMEKAILFNAKEQDTHSGHLRYSIRYLADTKELQVHLESINQVGGTNEILTNSDSKLNFSISILVLPLPHSPFLLKSSTMVYKNYSRGGGLIFSFLEEEEQDILQNHSWIWNKNSQATVSDSYKFHFDLSDFKKLQLNSTFVMFEIYFHTPSKRQFGGSFTSQLKEEDLITHSARDLSGFFSRASQALGKDDKFEALEERSRDEEEARVFMRHWQKRDVRFSFPFFN